MAGGHPRPVPFSASRRRLSLELDRVRAAIDAGTRMIIVNSPVESHRVGVTDTNNGRSWRWPTSTNLVLLADEV